MPGTGGSPELDDYFAGLRGELSQLDRLVGDAVGDLVTGFRRIGKLTRSQQEVSLAIVQKAAPAGGEPFGRLLDKQTAIVEQIEQEVDAAVISLQFGDLAAQLLGHTMIRIEALGAALARVKGISRAVMAANAATRGKPAVQQGMQTGGIELFQEES